MIATKVGAGPRVEWDTYSCDRCGIERPRHGTRPTTTCRDCQWVLSYEPCMDWPDELVKAERSRYVQGERDESACAGRREYDRRRKSHKTVRET